MSSDSSPATSRWKVRCPFDFTDAKSYMHTSSDGTRNVIGLNGLDRVSRHPGLCSFEIVDVGFGVLSPCLPARVWMSLPVIVALKGGAHIPTVDIAEVWEVNCPRNVKRSRAIFLLKLC